MAHHASTHSHSNHSNRGRGRGRSRSNAQQFDQRSQFNQRNQYEGNFSQHEGPIPYERQSYERHPQELEGEGSGWDQYYSDQDRYANQGRYSSDQDRYAEQDHFSRQDRARGQQRSDRDWRGQSWLDASDTGYSGGGHYGGTGQYAGANRYSGGQQTGGNQYAGGSRYAGGHFGGEGNFSEGSFSGGNFSGANFSGGNFAEDDADHYQQSDWQQSNWQNQANRQGQAGFRGRAPKDYMRSDERIREDVCECLTRDPYVDASEITVNVQSGVVTLEGSVSDRRQKFRSEDIADHCSGVQDVQNHLTLNRSSGDSRTNEKQRDETSRSSGSKGSVK